MPLMLRNGLMVLLNRAFSMSSAALNSRCSSIGVCCFAAHTHGSMMMPATACGKF